MADAAKIKDWSALRLNRPQFQRITHCVVRDNVVKQEILKFQEQARREAVDQVDFLGNVIMKGNNILEIHSDQFKIFAKHLQVNVRTRQSFTKAIMSILKQIPFILKTGDTSKLTVRKLESSDQGYDPSTSKVQFGSVTTQFVPAGTVLGQYVGELKLSEETAEDKALSEKSLDEESQELHEQDYTFSTGNVSEVGEMYIDSKHQGNETAFINDGFDQSNARYIQFVVNGVHCIFCVSMKDIAKDEQVLAKYGKRYWKPREELRKKRTGGADDGAKPLPLLRRNRRAAGFYTEARIRDRLPSAVEFLNSYLKGEAWSWASFLFSLEKLEGCQISGTVQNFLPILMNSPDDIDLVSQEVESVPSADPISNSEAPARQTRKNAPIEKTSDVVQRTKRTTQLEPNLQSSKRARADIVGSERSIIGTREIQKLERDSEEDDEEISMDTFLKPVQLNDLLNDREQTLAWMEEITGLVERLFKQELELEPSRQGNFLNLLKKCKEQLESSDPVSIMLLGDTGAGKSFLANLIMLMFAPMAEMYGLRAIFKPHFFSELQTANYASEFEYPPEIAQEKLRGLEGVAEISKDLNKSPEDVVKDLYLQLKRKKGTLNCTLVPFVGPDEEEAAEDDEYLKELMLVCEDHPAGGKKLEYVLSSRTKIGSTTGHIVRVRYGKIVHALVKFQSEQALREELLAFDWGLNAGPTGERKLLEYYQRKLLLFGLKAWPGKVEFMKAAVCSAVKCHLGQFHLIAGRGLSLRDDRLHLRQKLDDLLLSHDEGSEAAQVSMLVSECIVYFPADVLAGGVELIDAPGTNDEDPVKHAATCAALRNADGILVVLSSEVTTSVLDMLQEGGVLEAMLRGQGRPMALVHTCGESRGLMSNAVFLSRRAKDTRASLEEGGKKSLAKLGERLGAVYDGLDRAARAEVGARASAVEDALLAVRESTVCCLPVLWASNLMSQKPCTKCLEGSNGGGLIRVFLALRDQASARAAGPSPAHGGGDAVAEFVAECEDLIRAGDRECALPQDLYERCKEVCAEAKRRMDTAAEQKLLGEFDRGVQKPFLAELQRRFEGFLRECAGRFTDEVDAELVGSRLREVIDSKSAVVVANALQKPLRGSHAGLAFYGAIFDCLRRPDREDTCDLFRRLLQELHEDLRRRVCELLTGSIWELLGQKRASRAAPAPAGAECAERAALRCAVEAYLTDGQPGARHLRGEFDVCFGRPGGPRGPFELCGLRRHFEQACRESLQTNLLDAAAQHAAARGGEQSAAKSAVLLLLVQGLIKRAHTDAADLFRNSVQVDAEERAGQLLRRLVSRRVRKGGPLSTVYLLQGCLRTLAAPRPAAKLTQRQAARLALAATATDDFAMVVRHALHLARQAGAAAGGGAAVDRTVKAAALRRRRELAALQARTAGGGPAAD